MRNYKAKNVSSYIAEADAKARPTLKALRALVKTTIPKVEESISWGVPFYKFRGLLFGFAVFKNHVSFGFSSILDTSLKKELEAKGYKTGNKTVQIKFDQKLPACIIKQLLKTKAKANLAKKKAP